KTIKWLRKNGSKIFVKNNNGHSVIDLLGGDSVLIQELIDFSVEDEQNSSIDSILLSSSSTSSSSKALCSNSTEFSYCYYDYYSSSFFDGLSFTEAFKNSYHSNDFKAVL